MTITNFGKPMRDIDILIFAVDGNHTKIATITLIVAITN